MQDITRIYRIGSEEIYALNRVCLEVREEEYLVIMGPSGSGKSTMLNLIGALDKPTSGEIQFHNTKLSAMTAAQRASFRAFEVGYIFQAFNLIESLNALDNVRIPLILAGLTREQQKKRADNLLEIVGLTDRVKHKPSELSGGQKQRVAIARALANRPKLLLADEPTGNLDLSTGFKIVELLRSINEELGVTIINSTHDIKLIDAADRICWLRDGRIENLQEKIEVELTSKDISIQI